MRKLNGEPVTFLLPFELAKRMDRQRKKEGRSKAEFIRRVLDRYLLEMEFRSPDTSPEAQESIRKNKELLKLLRNS